MIRTITIIIILALIITSIPTVRSEYTSKTTKTIIVDINGNGDFTKLSEAINNSQNGTTIRIYDGVYRIRNIWLQKETKIIGNGSEKTYIQARDSFVITANNCHIEKIKYTGISGFTIESDNNIIKNCSIGHFIEFSIDLSFAFNNQILNNEIFNVSNVGIALSGSDNNKIIGNHIFNCGRGIRLISSNENEIRDNIFEKNIKGVDVYGYNNVIKGNKCFSNSMNDIYIDGYSGDNIVENNEGDVYYTEKGITVWTPLMTTVCVITIVGFIVFIMIIFGIIIAWRMRQKKKKTTHNPPGK